jgi:transposase
MSYSQDLREKIMAALRSGRQQLRVAREFGVSVSTVKRYLQLERETGSVQPRPRAVRQPLIKEAHMARLQAQVASHPDATLEQHVAFWADSQGQRVSVPTMCRALQRARLTRKKKA